MTKYAARPSGTPSSLSGASQEVPVPTQTNLETVQQQAMQAIAAVWERSRGSVMARVGVLEMASLAFQHKLFSEDDRLQTMRDVHQLAGSLGTFGFAEGSRIAFEIERLLDAADHPDLEQGRRFAALVAELRAVLESGSVGPSAAARPDAEPIRHQAIDSDVEPSDPSAVAAPAADVREQISPRHDVTPRDPTPASQGAEQRPDPSGQIPLAPEPPRAAASTQATPVEQIAPAPRETHEAAPEAAHTELSAGGGDQEPEQARISATRLLAVDDDPLILELLQALLEPSGMDVTTLNDPLRFEDVLNDISPDLLVLDVDMPGMTGIDLCRLARSNPRWSDVPVIFLTARTDAATVKTIFAVGGDDYITKPIVGPELLARIAIRAERDPLLPRVMMHLYQQRVRSELLATHAEERPGWRRLLAFGQNALARAVRR